MAKLLKVLTLVMGISCALIGLYHLVLGQWSVPGTGPSSATIDSRERFYSAVFFGYGLAWVWAARQSPIPARVVRVLAGIFLLGAIGRVISLVMLGWPHWLQSAEAGVELMLPFVFFWLAGADEHDARGSGGAASVGALTQSRSGLPR
ncbi:DUF4345 domain-containing protein [Mycobacterium malmoense]|uniref:DUF4345 domain-containing protein n=1 Tax=Mycobacterium malmoense TaxID=1780 RepID=A0ABX3SXL6_MYCMA|nr:DUF4345 domain-containing protein [Mycobacterium malmoense]ORA85395.1 hypothetical protein BST29_00540 [Mycobacterium malmoense]QZA17755.1 DUF4345 domain-containing protein [Mycobacterium malmoense]UNB94535.1 DUF4345 domain-containing protein [Mycobacterium malmoense]